MKKIIPIIGIILLASLFSACGNSLPASLTDVKMCNDADSEGMCSTDNSSFSTSDGDIYLSAQLENVSEGMKVQASWSLLKGEPGTSPREISSFTAAAPDSGSLPFHTYLSPPGEDWSRGDYEVILTLLIENSQPVSKPFTIK